MRRHGYSKLSFEEIAKKLGVDFPKPRMAKYGRRNAGKFLREDEQKDRHAEWPPRIAFPGAQHGSGKLGQNLGKESASNAGFLRPVARVSATKSARLRIDLSGS